MTHPRFALAALLVGLLFVFAGCGGDDDDDAAAPGDDDAADDDAGDDDAGDDDDAGGDGNEPVKPPQPLTPCCVAPWQPSAMEDPGLPASGAGPFAAAVLDREFVDAARDRTIPAEVFFPSDDGAVPSNAGAPYPVVAVTHGFSSTGDMVRAYGERLATWGYIAIVPDLPYTSFFDVFQVNHNESAADILFLMNTACCENDDPQSAFFERVDRWRLATAGHSLGGKLSVLAALLDGGPLAAAGIDPVDGAGPLGESENLPVLNPDRLPDLVVPTLYLGSEFGGVPVLGQACAPEEFNYERFWTNSPPPSTEILFQGAGHNDFVRFPFDFCPSGGADKERVQALAAEYVVAFLNTNLRGWERFREDYAGAGADADRDAGDVEWRTK